MYIPSYYEVTDSRILEGFMRQYPFATLVTAPGGVPFASHLPFVIGGGNQTLCLRAHLARANPQAAHLQRPGEVLVIFQGPHAYVSNRWYASAPNVPTWNYATVHAYGTVRVVGEAERLAHLHELSETFDPGALGAAPERYLEGMARGTVGFELTVTRLEGKFKLSQNRRPEDQAGVRAALEASADPLEREIARLMREQAALEG
ncbi:transcriptional regulator [Deinobacterium chartae]|uniref:Transcriptional regulator n=1 Tax=Deinobacterium chartae TaxID=521158 RepID=A0A841HYA7_9DEIO|nr:transcriptional regulator [Deinobacterium chartae]